MATKMRPLSGLNLRKVGGSAAGPRPEATNRASVQRVNHQPHDRELGARFRYWLGLTVEELLEANGISHERAADHVGLSKESLVNFVNGRSRPHNEEGVVAGIGQLCGVDEPRSIYAEALKRWMRHGYQPPPSPQKSRRGPI